MAMYVVVEKAEAVTRSGTSQRTGKPWTMRVQMARLKSDLLAGPLELTLGDDQPPYPAGIYALDLERSVRLNNYGVLEFGRYLVLDGPKQQAPAAGLPRAATG
jgi:hypothetical protein